jgi:2-methylcitrate dehydratase PrpD
MTQLDAAGLLVERSVAAASAADPRTLARAADCLALALVEMKVSARMPQWRDAAAAIAASPGRATVTGLRRRAATPDAVVANAFLLHANLADDSYRVAAHPGIAVIPAALAGAEESGDVEAIDFLRAIVGGYEASCLFAEAILPEVAERGWRVTAVIAPVGAAVTLAQLHQVGSADAAAAVRIGAAQAGGVLAVVVSESDGWRIQPALAVGAGVWAFRAARGGLQGAENIFEAQHGAVTPLTGQPLAAWADSGTARPRIHDVTFKTYAVAMYGQAIFNAFERSQPLVGHIASIRLRLPPFAVAYGDQRRERAAGVASVAAIAIDAVRAFHSTATPPLAADVEVVADATLGPLAADVTVAMRNGPTFELAGDGDTSNWGAAEVERHCLRRLGGHGHAVHHACRALRDGGTLADVINAWRRTK